MQAFNLFLGFAGITGSVEKIPGLQSGFGIKYAAKMDGIQAQNLEKRGHRMKKLCFLLALLLLLTGCGKDGGKTPHPDTADRMVSFDIYAINDLHGRLADTDDQSGLDELSTYLKMQTGNGILLSVGDMWQGTAEANLTRGLIITEWMNRMDFTAMTLGGHEFDWGEAWLRENSQLAEFPFLGINVYSRDTDERVDYCQSSLTVDIQGAQIGIIGAIGDCYSSISAEFTKNLYFKTGDELTALVKAEAEKLRSQGADFIIYTVHDGYDRNTPDTDAMTVADGELAGYYDTALSDGYVDLVFEADSHYWYVLKDQRGVYHLQGGGNNDGLSHARVMIDKVCGTSTVLTAELIPDSTYQYMADDPVVEELLEQYADQIAPAERILGNNSQYRSNDEISQLVADLYCSKGLEKWGEDYDIVLGGGYLSCRSPGYLNPGQVSYRQLLSLLPFDNQITLCSIRGRDLTGKFLENRHSTYHIQTTDYGDSIRHSIDPDATYYVVTDSYTAYYPYNNMTVIDIYEENIFARDLVADHVTQEGFA